MTGAEAEMYLRCHRPGRVWKHPRLAKALRASRRDPELARRLEEQGKLDARITGAIHAIALPDALKGRLDALVGATKPASETISPRLVQFAVLAVAFGLAVIIGLGISMELNRRADFPGRETVGRIVATADAMSGVELDPVAKPVSELDDWFFMRGFEGFIVPAGLAKLKGLGARMFEFNGKRVAQVAVDSHSSLLYVFRASDFGVEAPGGDDWRVLEHEGWVAAVRPAGDLCVVLAFRGTRTQMHDFLRTLQPPA